MPVYEFYCPECHMIFNFFSRRINTEKKPDCPKCKRKELERQVSIFAISKNRQEEDDFMPDIDESKLEQAMMSMASEIENLDEEDPRQAAAVMRKLMSAIGMDIGGPMEEAISRMEAGEDPDKIEEEMGDLLEGDDLFKNMGKAGGLKNLRKKYLRPSVDETLYEL